MGVSGYADSVSCYNKAESYRVIFTSMPALIRLIMKQV